MRTHKRSRCLSSRLLPPGGVPVHVGESRQVGVHHLDEAIQVKRFASIRVLPQLLQHSHHVRHHDLVYTTAGQAIHCMCQVCCLLFNVLATPKVISVSSLMEFCCCTSLQHLRSYQDEYWLVTLRTHGDFIVLPHWEIRLPEVWPNILLCHTVTVPRLNKKQQVSIGLTQPGIWSPGLLHAKPTLYRFGHHTWLYQDRHRPVTVHSGGDFIALPH